MQKIVEFVKKFVIMGSIVIVTMLYVLNHPNPEKTILYQDKRQQQHDKTANWQKEIRKLNNRITILEEQTKKQHDNTAIEKTNKKAEE